MSPKRATLTAKKPTRQAQTWVKQGTGLAASEAPAKADVYTARLTLDITPELRQKIKLAAIAGGTTVAELLRQLLEREFASASERQT